jgi:PAS domain S-box-containing protein
MSESDLRRQLEAAHDTIRALQDELAETNRGLVALTMELEKRVDDGTAELRAAQEELQKTNSELLQLTLELEDRVAERTAELSRANTLLEAQAADLARANRALRTISDCNQVLVRAESEADLLSQVCHIIVETGGYRMAWVGYAEQDGERTVRAMEQAGVDDGFLSAINFSWADTESGHTPMGTAIRTGKPHVVRIAADPVYALWRDEALQRGYATCMAFPLVAEGRAFGGLGIFAAAPDAFDDAEVKLLAELANDLAYGIETLRARAARQRAEEALRESLERYHRTLDNMLEGCQIIGFDWRYLYVNDAVARHGRRAKEELLGRAMMEVYPGIENTDMFAVLRRCMEERTPNHIENEFAYPGGERAWFELSVEPVPEGIFILSIDITERKRVEEALRASEQKFSILFEKAAFAAALSRLPDGAIVEVNEAFERWFGYTRQEVAGKTSRDLGINPDAEGRARILADLQARGSVRDLELTLLTKPRGPRAFLVNIDLVDIGGEKYILQTTQDITERKQAEEQLRETLVKLERNNRELQDFAYVASHDLQEPLRKIQAFGDRLAANASDKLDEKSRDYLARMHAAAGRMQTLINDLLAFSRVTTKAQPFASTDLNRVLKDVLSDLEVRIEKSGGRVEANDLPTIEADATQMRQVLQNLIGNALKFHKPDVLPLVKVYAVVPTVELPTGQTVSIVVEDNGIGFDEKYLDRIFAPFQRLHARGEYEGTGIGLAVVRKIVERHGGSVTAKSKPGAGATFIVTLPARQIPRSLP